MIITVMTMLTVQTTLVPLTVPVSLDTVEMEPRVMVGTLYT